VLRLSNGEGWSNVSLGLLGGLWVERWEVAVVESIGDERWRGLRATASLKLVESGSSAFKFLPSSLWVSGLVK
jgi:hypothetical protein